MQHGIPPYIAIPHCILIIPYFELNRKGLTVGGELRAGVSN